MERGFSEWAFGGRRCPDRLFFLTRGSREACRPAVEGVVPESHWQCLPNGLDLAWNQHDPVRGRQFREQYRLGNGPLIGATAWLRPGKQLEHLYHIIESLDRSDVTLVLAGGVAPGEESYATRLLEEGEKRLGRRLRFLGYLDDLRGLYNSLDIYVNTSQQESFGISVLEALACGCPVVGYGSSAVDELVLPDGGEITPQDDMHQLADAVQQWFDAPSRLAEAKIGARRQAERFDIRKIANQLWDEYAEVLAERNVAIAESAAAV